MKFTCNWPLIPSCLFLDRLLWNSVDCCTSCVFTDVRILSHFDFNLHVYFSKLALKVSFSLHCMGLLITVLREIVWAGKQTRRSYFPCCLPLYPRIELKIEPLSILLYIMHESITVIDSWEIQPPYLYNVITIIG